MAYKPDRRGTGRHAKSGRHGAGRDAKSDDTNAVGETSPSARAEALSLVVEFFKMSRTTMILLIAFVLTLALYMLVREDPVVAFGSPPRSGPTPSETTDTRTSTTDGPSTAEQSTEPTATTEPSGSETPTDTSATETSVPAGQRGADPGEGTTGGQPPSTQASQNPQAPGAQAPQQTQQQPQQTQVPVQ